MLCACCRHKSARPGCCRPARRPACGRVFRPQREPSLFRNLRAYLLRNRFTVNNFAAIRERIPSVSLRKGMRIFCQKRASLSVLVCCFILSEANLACYDHGYYMVIGALRPPLSRFTRALAPAVCFLYSWWGYFASVV